MKASSEAVVIRDAEESDIGGIQKIFTACYADHYVYPQYYDAERLKRLIFDRDVVFLVVAEKESGRILGTGSVIVDIGASGDLMGEFGRLAVHHALEQARTAQEVGIHHPDGALKQTRVHQPAPGRVYQHAPGQAVALHGARVWFAPKLGTTAAGYPPSLLGGASPLPACTCGRA